LGIYAGGIATVSSYNRGGHVEEEEEQDLEKDPEFTKEDRQPTRLTVYLSFIPILFLLLHSLFFPLPNTHTNACTRLPPSLRPISCSPSLPALPSSSVDLVIAYYNEDLENTRTNLDYVRRVTFVAERDSRVIVYNKGEREESALRDALR
jgi:hypothetical protein